MEFEEIPPPAEAVERSSHRSKKRKHVDSDKQPSSKKRKHVDAKLQNAHDTPSKSSKSKKTPKSPKATSKSHLSSPPLPASVTNPEAEPDHDNPLPDAPSITNEQSPAPAPESTSSSSPFHLTTSSLYLPIPAIALSPITALPSLLTTHLTPLLLTYYPPLRGIILSITNPILSSRRPPPDHPPPPLPQTNSSASSTVLAHCADDGGLSYVWLTATFLLFRPGIGDELEGWLNVCSEGFVGLVCYNYFQVAVARSRIPGAWRWIPPGGEDVREGKGKGRVKRKKTKGKDKGKGREVVEEGQEGEQGDSQATLVDAGLDAVGKEHGTAGEEEGEEAFEREDGYFIREDGTRVTGSVKFRVVDCEIVPGPDRESWSLQVEGTFLNPAEEESVLDGERQREFRKQNQALMSGGLGRRNGATDQSRRGTPN